ncbi:MAG: carboxymuconolactone decarboxylase family protein [Acidimicrobiia bacterium]
MSFLRTIDEESAPEDVAAIYEKDIGRLGYLPNYTRIFSLHPDAYLAWRGLVGAIARPMDELRYELAAIGAAGRLRSSYCSLAHGKTLNDEFFRPAEVRQIVHGRASSVLDETDALIVEFAAKVAEDATTVSEEDIERLRAAGLSDRDIFDVVLAAAARSFFTKVIDATGTLADSVYMDMDPELRDALTVGRPIEAG